MASLTASLRLNFSANTGPIGAAIRQLRTLRGAVADSTLGARDPVSGARPGLGQTVFAPSAGAFRVAAHIGQAAAAMNQFKAQMIAVTKGPIDKFADFELMMARVKGRTDNITGAGFERLKQAAEAAGASTTFTATEAAEGLFELAGAGLNVEQQIGALRPVLRLAQASQLGLGQASAIATNTMAQFGLSVADIPQIADLLNTAANASTIELAELGDTMQYAGVIAKDAGLDLKQTASFAALLGNAGITGSMAGTSLRAMLARLAHVAPRANKALREVGLSAKDMAAGVKDPIAFFKKLDVAFQRKGFDEQKRLSALIRLFGNEAASGVASLMSAGSKVDAQGQTAFDRMSVAMDNHTGSVERFANEVENTTAGKLKLFQSQVDALQMQLGEAFVPALQDLTKALQPVISDVGAWVKENPRLTATIGRLAIGTGAVLAVLGPLALAMSSVATVWGVLGPAFRLGILPIQAGGAALAALRVQLLATGTAAGAFGAALTGAVGLVGAAFAGWKVGEMLDSAIGKALKLRGELLSTEAALSAGESQGFNAAMLNVAETFGIDSLRDVAQGNIQRTELEQNMKREREARAAQAAKPPPAEVAIDVQVTDDRTIVSTKQKNSAGAQSSLRTGSTI